MEIRIALRVGAHEHYFELLPHCIMDESKKHNKTCECYRIGWSPGQHLLALSEVQACSNWIGLYRFQVQSSQLQH